MKVGATPFLYEDLDRECIYNLSKEEEKKTQNGVILERENELVKLN
jgi:hypothetical protein